MRSSPGRGTDHLFRPASRTRPVRSRTLFQRRPQLIARFIEQRTILRVVEVMRDITLRHHPRTHHIQRVMYAKHDAGIAVARRGSPAHQSAPGSFPPSAAHRCSRCWCVRWEGTSVGGVRLVVLYHHIVRHQMNGIARIRNGRGLL